MILETSRLATIVNGLLRKTTQDVELNGMFNKLMVVFIMVDIICYDWCIIRIVLLFDPCKSNVALITTYHIDNCEECCVLSTTQIIMGSVV